MNLRPLSDHIIIKPVKEETTTKSGIVLPDTSDKERPERGEIIAVGPGKLHENGNVYALNVKVGDRVIFKKYGPDEIKIDNQEYLIASEDDVLAVIEG